MNKKLLPLIFFFIITLSARGQTNVYHPFPDSGAVWIMNWQHWCTSSSTGCLLGCGSNYQYRVDGDTLISGNIYKKIIKGSFLKHCVCTMITPNWGTPSCSQDSFYSDFVFGVRNDTSNKKVYINYGIAPEQLVYDFNLNVGDSLQTGFCNKPIVKIDSVLIGSDYRKCYWLDTSLAAAGYDDRIIEGIGHVGNFFGGPFDPCGPCVCENLWGFSCFRQNGNVLYGNSTCSLVSSVGEIVDEKNAVTIFPNPASSEFNIENSKLKIELVEIYDVMGGKQIALPLNPLKGTSASIDVSGLSPGIYFVRVRTEKGSVIKKLIKQ